MDNTGYSHHRTVHKNELTQMFDSFLKEHCFCINVLFVTDSHHSINQAHLCMNLFSKNYSKSETKF